MIIGFDGSRAFVPDRTGTENYSFQVLKNLAKIDRKNKYMVYIRPDSVILSETKDLINSSDSSLVAQNDKKDWPENFQFIKINWRRLWTQGGLSLQTFKDNLDVLFVPAHTLPIVKRPGLKTIVTVHDLGSEYLPTMHQLKQRLYLGFMQKRQLKTATKIIAVSKATKEDLVARIGIDSKKIEVVYEGFDQALFKPARNVSHSVAGGPVKNDLLINTLIHYNLQPKTYFLFVGTVQPRKNLERLIRAFAVIPTKVGIYLTGPRSELDSRLRGNDKGTGGFRLRSNNNFQLVIAGSKGWMSDEIYNLPKKLGIEDMVKFLGYVPEKDLPALYSGAYAFTFPSLFEGFGLPILEAQACGCPVLTSNTSSMPEVAGKGALFVDPYSVDDIVKGMGQINNQETRNKIIKAGFENIKRFSWEKCARETLEVLLSV